MDDGAMIKSLAGVIDDFRAIDDPRDLWDLEGAGNQLQLWEHAELEKTVDTISAALAEANPMLSQEETRRRLTYDAIVPSIRKDWGDRTTNSRDIAEALIVELLAYERTTAVELPVLYMTLDAPFTISNVTFEALDVEHFRKSGIGQWTYDIYDGRLRAKARVDSPGDDWKYLTNAVAAVDSALRLLSGVLFPWQIGQPAVPAVVGNGPQPGATPFRTPHPYGEPGWDGSFGAMHRPGGTMDPAGRVAELWVDDSDALLKFLNSARTTPTERRLYTAFRWLGEACRAHDTTSRFVAAVTALEALLSLRNDESRTAAGTTSMLAERAAFLAGSTGRRITTHREVARLYNTRSDAVHGRVSEVPPADVVTAGTLAWTVAQALFQRRNELRTDEDVTAWVLAQRYGE